MSDVWPDTAEGTGFRHEMIAIFTLLSNTVLIGSGGVPTAIGFLLYVLLIIVLPLITCALFYALGNCHRRNQNAASTVAAFRADPRPSV